jgi:hypothetical protein
MSMLCLELNSHKHLWFSTLKKIAKTKFWEKKIQNPWLTFELLVKISWGHIHYSLRKVCTNWWNLDFVWLNFASSVLLYWFRVCMKLLQSVVFHDTVPTFFCFPIPKCLPIFFSDPFLDYLVTCWFKWPRFVEEKLFGLIMGYRPILEKNSDCFPFTPWSPFHSFNWH